MAATISPPSPVSLSTTCRSLPADHVMHNVTVLGYHWPLWFFPVFQTKHLYFDAFTIRTPNTGPDIHYKKWTTCLCPKHASIIKLTYVIHKMLRPMQTLQLSVPGPKFPDCQQH